MCTLDSSLLDDFDFDLDVDLEADVVLEAEELDLEAEVLDLEADVLDLDVLVVRGSAMVEGVVVLNGCRCRWWSKLQFVDVEAVDEATAAERQMGAARNDNGRHWTQQQRARCSDQQKRRRGASEHVRPMLADGCGVVVCAVWGTVREVRGRAGVQLWLRHQLEFEGSGGAFAD